MTLTTSMKVAWLALILAGVALAALLRPDARASAPAPRARTELVKVDLGGGKQALLDAGRYPVPLRKYQHIAAGSTIADDLLLALAEPERIAVLSRYGREHAPDLHRYGQRPSFGGATDLELLTKQGVDLLILNHLGAPSELARARELGIEVFNLGEMRGLSTLLPNIQAVALLLGDPARGERLADKLTRRLRAVAADLAPRAKKRALYVSAYAGQLFGGGRRTSFHDVLSAAGLIDVAAEKFDDFPHYDPEQLLLMQPEIVVTQNSSVAMICRVAGLANLPACAEGGRGVIGMDDALLGDPGLGMLDAAEVLHDKVYARPAGR